MAAPKLSPKALELIARLEAKEKAKPRDKQADSTEAKPKAAVIGWGPNPLDFLDGAK